MPGDEYDPLEHARALRAYRDSPTFCPGVNFVAVVDMALKHVVHYWGDPLGIAAVTLIAEARRDFRDHLRLLRMRIH